MTHLDLFSGIGGFALAAKWADIETVGFCEIDPFCQKVLKKNFQNTPIHGDIASFKPPKVDVVTGGFPCQPFSVAGKRRGVNDERYLWNEMLRVIRESQPTWIIGENVTGIIKMELDNILTSLEAEGYTAQPYIIPACAVEAPHRRERIWIVAYSPRNRCNSRCSDRKERYIQTNEEWDVKTLQSKWEKFKPKSWEAYKAKDWFTYTSKVSRSDDGLSGRLDRNRIKALGNAIVPQVVLPIMLSIKAIENDFR